MMTIWGASGSTGVSNHACMEDLVLDLTITSPSPGMMTFATRLPLLSLPTFLSDHFQIKAIEPIKPKEEINFPFGVY